MIIKVPFSTATASVEEGVEETLTQLSRWKVVIRNRGQVSGYLVKHADTASVLPQLCELLRRQFGPDAELALRLYRDPECDDKHLDLVVRLEAYDEHVIDQIDAAVEPLDEQLAQISGYVLVTTDFGRPDKKHAV